MKELTGDTYPHRATIKARGGRWQPEQRCWLVPESEHECLSKLVAGEGTTDDLPAQTREEGCRYKPGDHLDITLGYRLPTYITRTRLEIMADTFLVTGLVTNTVEQGSQFIHSITIDGIEQAPARLTKMWPSEWEAEDEDE